MARRESRSNRAPQTRDEGGMHAPVVTRTPAAVGGPRISVVVVDGALSEGGEGGAVVGPPIHVVGHAAAGPDAMALVDRVRPDVVLLHLDPAGEVAGETIEALRATHPLTRIVVADALHETEPRHPETTGDGCVVTDTAFVEVVAGIQRVAGGEHPDGARNGLTGGRRPGSVPALTRREHQILRLVAMGNTNNEIAQRLGLAANTVKTYWQRALHKLSARNRAEAIARAHDLDLI
jgi:two-component system, NarL family, nitrate/nitrite response regulator NarL